jgi:glycerol kinase
MAQSTAWGVAKLAGLAVGFWKSVEELEAIDKAKVIYHPKMDPAIREKLYGEWKRAMRSALVY